jgi:hypothetical protein
MRTNTIGGIMAHDYRVTKTLQVKHGKTLIVLKAGAIITADDYHPRPDHIRVWLPNAMPHWLTRQTLQEHAERIGA